MQLSSVPNAKTFTEIDLSNISFCVLRFKKILLLYLERVKLLQMTRTFWCGGT